MKCWQINAECLPACLPRMCCINPMTNAFCRQDVINHDCFSRCIFSGGWHNSKHGAKYCSASASFGPIALATNKWTSHVNCCIRKCRVSTWNIPFFYLSQFVLLKVCRNGEMCRNTQFFFLFHSSTAEIWKAQARKRRATKLRRRRKEFFFSSGALSRLGFVRLYSFFPCTSNTASDLPQSIIKWKVYLYIRTARRRSLKVMKTFFPFLILSCKSRWLCVASSCIIFMSQIPSMFHYYYFFACREN